MANKSDLTTRQWESFEDTGKEKQIQLTLSATPGTVTVVTCQNDAKGFRIKPESYDVVFSVNAAPAALATSSDTTIAASSFSVGNTALADSQETRLLPSASNGARTIQIRSTVASVVVLLETF